MGVWLHFSVVLRIEDDYKNFKIDLCSKTLNVTTLSPKGAPRWHNLYVFPYINMNGNVFSSHTFNSSLKKDKHINPK